MTQIIAPALCNGCTVGTDDVPLLAVPRFREVLLKKVARRARVAALLAIPDAGRKLRMLAVLALEGRGQLDVLSCDVGESYPALTPECPQVHLFEREMAEQWSVTPVGHPWLKPVRFLPGRTCPPGGGDFYAVHGEEVHEVAVGPVHAGVIEPGHFRFQCHGENVLHLEIALGFQHRGVERALVRGPHKRLLPLMETVAGDTSVGHALAYCELLEGLAGAEAPPRAHVLRMVALELERIANHAGDLGALAGDVGFLPTAAWCGRLRGDVLNLTAMLCGNRLGRGMICPGGTAFDVDEDLACRLTERLEEAVKSIGAAARLALRTPSVLARFESTGVVSEKTCLMLGLVGPAARACGVERDVRADFPSGLYRFSSVPVSTAEDGDVFARACVRLLEIERSAGLVASHLKDLPSGPCRTTLSAPAPGRLGVSLVEGWRGEICHVAVTDAGGRFSAYKVVDPSFHNWMGLAMAMRSQAISDFPLCNKSFNLSYCGHDL